MLPQIKAFPMVLSFSEAKYYIFTAAFAVSAVFFPWLAHQFHVAGQIFLPMHFFVIIAGLLFGWRVGMVVGLASPMLSYGIAHMPALAILPETMLELAVYGFAAGFLRGRNWNIWTTLISAMVLGRLARIFWILILGTPSSSMKFLQISWPGILLQIAIIPVIIYFLQKFVFEKRV